MKPGLMLATVALALMTLGTGCLGNDPGKIATEAMNRTDPLICDRISDYRMRYNCSMEVAVSQDNTTMCGNIGSEDWRNECYSNIAARRRDVTVCEPIRSDVQREKCYRRVAGS